MSADETPKDESGGLSNEPLPGGGSGAQPPENPAQGSGDEPTKPMPESPAQPPAAPQPGGAAPPPPPPPPAAPAAAGNPAAPIPGVASGPGQPGLAIASFVCGIIGILLVWCCGFGGLLSIAAIITGVIAKGEVEKRGAPSWMWITGVALGAVGLVILLIWAIVVGINFSTNPNWDVETS